MRARISLLALLVISLCPLCRASGPMDVKALEPIVNQDADLVKAWEREARQQIVLMIAGIVCGGLITVLQPWGSKNWCKIASGLLGVSAAVFTFVISKAPVNYAAYQRAVLHGNDKIHALREKITYLEAAHEPDDQKVYREDFIRIANDFDQISLQLVGNDQPSPGSQGGRSSLWQTLPVVYAQSASPETPAWVTTLPASTSDLYFHGEAESQSLSEAKARSFQDAVEQCTKYLLAQAASAGIDIPIDNVREFARTSSIVADTALTYDNKSGTHRYHTLLRLQKSLARPEVVAALSPRTSGETNPTQVTVPARDRWTKTSVEVRQGDTISFLATGQIRWSNRSSEQLVGPNGSTSKLKARLGSYPVPTMGAGALIAKIGPKGTPFAVGERTAITAPTTGTVYLGINDNFFSDNSGTFQVTITKQ